MAFSIKAWLDRFGSGGSFDQPTDTGATPTTPVDAGGLRDMETRLSGYTDSREAAEISARNTAIGSHATAETSARTSAIAAAITAQGDLATQVELDAHVNDTTAAHAASAIAVSPAVGGDATVQAVLTTHETRLDAAQSGSPVLYGAGAPGSGVGVNGDSYVDTTNHRLYGPKAAGAWPGTYEQLGAAGSLPSGTDGQIVGYVGTTPTALDVDTAVAPSDIGAIAAALVNAKGDLLVATANDTVARQAVGTDGYALVADSSQTNGVKYSHRPQVATASKTGVLTAAAGTVRLPIMEAGTIEDVRIMVGTAPTGAALIVDVNKNGTTIFTTQANRPTVAISGNASSAATPDVTSLAAGDYLTVDIDQIGSTVAGSDLCVAVRYRLAA